VRPEELRRAHEIAAAARAACDVLKGGPRSSKDDPEFVDTFYKASRLHFIGNSQHPSPQSTGSAPASQVLVRWLAPTSRASVRW
jgi:hypothetical protein